MIRLHWKIQLILLLISLFFVGLGIQSIAEKKSPELFYSEIFYIFYLL